MLLDNIIDKLIGVTIAHSMDKNINQKQFIKIEREFYRLTSFWGKACFIVALQSSKSLSNRAIGGKLLRDAKSREMVVYKRHVEPFIPEIKRDLFTTNGANRVANRVKDALTYQGEREFIILSRILYNTGNTNVLDSIEDIRLSKDKMVKITNNYD